MLLFSALPTDALFVFLARCPCALPLCNALVWCSCAVVHLCDAPIQCVQLLFFSSLPLGSTNTLPSAISLCNLFLWCPSGALLAPLRNVLLRWLFAIAWTALVQCFCAMLLCGVRWSCAMLTSRWCFCATTTLFWRPQNYIIQTWLPDFHPANCVDEFALWELPASLQLSFFCPRRLSRARLSTFDQYLIATYQFLGDYWNFSLYTMW